MALIDNIKTKLGLTDTTKDSLLNLLIDEAKVEAQDYCHISEYDDDLDTAISMMVVINYNKMGSEGLSSEGYSGVSYNYSSDYPESVMRILRSHRKIRTV